MDKLKLNLSKIYDAKYKKTLVGSNLPATRQLDNSVDPYSRNFTFLSYVKKN